jgi:hypothetical protein
MTAHSKIGKYAIHSGYALNAQEPLKVTEIMRYENKAFIGHAVPACVCILIKTKEPPFRIQVSQDLC